MSYLPLPLGSVTLFLANFMLNVFEYSLCNKNNSYFELSRVLIKYVSNLGSVNVRWVWIYIWNISNYFDKSLTGLNMKHAK